MTISITKAFTTANHLISLQKYLRLERETLNLYDIDSFVKKDEQLQKLLQELKKLQQSMLDSVELQLGILADPNVPSEEQEEYANKTYWELRHQRLDYRQRRDAFFAKFQ